AGRLLAALADFLADPRRPKAVHEYKGALLARAAPQAPAAAAECSAWGALPRTTRSLHSDRTRDRP
ncbi:hypothetical protein AB0M72_11960, partial [Nocardiopsis dassonvillei]